MVSILRSEPVAAKSPLRQPHGCAPFRRDRRWHLLLGRLRQAAATHLTARAKAHGVAMGETTIQYLLALDIDLDAQGLEVWLIRRARRHESQDG
jgi:hypothetical protein